MNAFSVILFQFVFTAVCGVALSSAGIYMGIKLAGFGRGLGVLLLIVGGGFLYQAGRQLIEFFGRY